VNLREFERNLHQSIDIPIMDKNDEILKKYKRLMEYEKCKPAYQRYASRNETSGTHQNYQPMPGAEMSSASTAQWALPILPLSDGAYHGNYGCTSDLQDWQGSSNQGWVSLSFILATIYDNAGHG
jgi:hypothetical protein